MAKTDREIFKKKAADVFTFLDHDQDGNLKLEDLRRGFKKLGIPLATHDDILEELQYHNGNVVTKEGFEEYSEKQFEKVKNLFDKIDKRGDNRITLDELIEGLQEFDPHCKVEENGIKRLFKVIDQDNDGAIGFDEWCRLLIFLPQLNIKTVIKYWEIAVTICEQNEFPLLEFQEEASQPLIVSSSSSMQGELTKWLNSFGAGFFAGVVSRTTTAPLDRLKFIYQVHYKDSNKPPSIKEGLKNIYKNDGIKGLFRGNLVNILKASPETSIRLTVFEKLKSVLIDEETHKLSLRSLFVAGAASGVVANLAIFPMEVLRTRLSAAPSGTYFGIFDAIKKIVKTEGMIRPFYKGLQASLSATVPNSGLNLMSYEVLKTIFLGQRPTTEPSPIIFMVVGGLSAMFSSTLLYPFQIVTSRLIMQNLLEKGSEKRGMFGLASSIYKSEGGLGFYKGYAPAISKIVLGNAIAFSCFEFLKKNLGVDFRK